MPRPYCEREWGVQPRAKEKQSWAAASHALALCRLCASCQPPRAADWVSTPSHSELQAFIEAINLDDRAAVTFTGASCK